MHKNIPNPVLVRRRLLRWYDQNGRELPWRYKKGQIPDPYYVWLSEIMLAQTTVKVVKGYFDKFLNRWPTIEKLANAELDEVLHAWQGLGYYARARNLHKTAKIIVGEMGGHFPDTELALRKLPGIGDYTAAAIATIVFNKVVTPVDVNIERVTSRLFAFGDMLPKGKMQIRKLASVLTPNARPGDFAQALMDLGSGVCNPKKPDCKNCPLKLDCLAFMNGNPNHYPVKSVKPVRNVRRGMVFWVIRKDGRVMMRLRSKTGLLGGMAEFPSTNWREKDWTFGEAIKKSPIRGSWRQLDGMIRHTFSHFHLELRVLAADLKMENNFKDANKFLWVLPSQFPNYALPSIMKKVAHHVANESIR